MRYYAFSYVNSKKIAKFVTAVKEKIDIGIEIAKKATFGRF